MRKGSVRPDELEVESRVKSIGIGMGPWRWTLKKIGDWFPAQISSISVSAHSSSIIQNTLLGRLCISASNNESSYFSKRCKTRFVFAKAPLVHGRFE